MAHQDTKSSAIGLQSLVDSHDKPFVVIDRDYRIMAVNKAYRQVYGVDSDTAIGNTCFKVSHGNNKPCEHTGEDCPHSHLFETGEPHSCLHTHYDSNDCAHQVRVTAIPLRSPDGKLVYMGETIEALSPHEDCCDTGTHLVGQSKPFLACMEQLNLAAGSNATVLLQGETGTGKELAARFINDHSERKSRPFVVVDCNVLSGSVFETELFGQAESTNNGGTAEKAGYFEEADGGTLCFDDIRELPLPLQAKLLRVLETGQYRKIGSHRMCHSDVRIICLTNSHLWEAVLAGQFREDLYYRIACLNIQVPALRERLDDIPLLAKALLKCTSRMMQHCFSLTSDAEQRLMNYHYPGNVRELRNILDIAATRSSNTSIDTENVQEVIFQLAQSREEHHKETFSPAGSVLEPDTSGTGNGTATAQDLSSLQVIEAKYINELLHRYDGNRRQVAAALGVSSRTLYRKLKRYMLS